jgi:hypothetical protein
MSYDYYCHRCHQGYNIGDLKRESVLSCPECLGGLDTEGYVCDGCDAIMNEVYAYAGGKPICKQCAGFDIC